jgi:SAM-dependent methyltransferase
MRLAVAILAFGLAGCATRRDEVVRISGLLDWKPGACVADVGAGRGAYAAAAATVVGDSGRVFATEVDAAKLERLRRIAQKYPNLRVVEGARTVSGLTPACCDSILLRGVYHHLTEPKEFNADLLRALKPGGRLAVIDFPPKKLLSWFFPIKGVPANRGGHGIPRSILLQELRSAGFQIEQEFTEWPGKQYCVIARKPPGAAD